jgi:hypothetical protein
MPLAHKHDGQGDARPVPDGAIWLTCRSRTRADAIRRNRGAWRAEGRGFEFLVFPPGIFPPFSCLSYANPMRPGRSAWCHRHMVTCRLRAGRLRRFFLAADPAEDAEDAVAVLRAAENRYGQENDNCCQENGSSRGREYLASEAVQAYRSVRACCAARTKALAKDLAGRTGDLRGEPGPRVPVTAVPRSRRAGGREVISPGARSPGAGCGKGSGLKPCRSTCRVTT